MEMAPARLSAMCMHLIFEFDWYSNKASVTDAALRDYMPSELADVAHRAPQHRYLHATVVIKMDMHRRPMSDPQPEICLGRDALCTIWWRDGNAIPVGPDPSLPNTGKYSSLRRAPAVAD
jgi:hypothetical protein